MWWEKTRRVNNLVRSKQLMTNFENKTKFATKTEELRMTIFMIQENYELLISLSNILRK